MHINQQKRPPKFRIKGRGHIDWLATQGAAAIITVESGDTQKKVVAFK